MIILFFDNVKCFNFWMWKHKTFIRGFEIFKKTKKLRKLWKGKQIQRYVNMKYENSKTFWECILYIR